MAANEKNHLGDGSKLDSDPEQVLGLRGLIADAFLAKPGLLLPELAKLVQTAPAKETNRSLKDLLWSDFAGRLSWASLDHRLRAIYLPLPADVAWLWRT